MFGQNEGRHRLEHRHFDILAFAGAGAMKKCGEHRVHHRHAGRLVREQGGHVMRRFGFEACHGGHARGGLDDVVESRTAAPGTVFVEARRRAIDEPRIDRAHCLIAEAQPRNGFGAHVVDQHVGAGDERFQHVRTVRLAQVECEGAFVAVHGEKNRTHPRMQRHAIGAHHVAVGTFDLDDVGTVIAEDLGRERAQHNGGEIENPHAAKRSAVFL